MVMNSKVKRSLWCWLALSPFVVMIIFPYAVMLSTALKPKSEVFTFPPTWLPDVVQWSNFVDMWHETKFGDALFNSLYISLSATFLSILVSIPAAYALARFRFRGKTAFRFFLLISQMLSPIVLVIGLFRLVVFFGLMDNINSLVFIYAAFNIAFAVWMLQNYFTTIPADLEESAWLEGAGWVRSVIKVFLPMAIPAIAVTAIFVFINSWNEFVLALTILRSESSFTLPIQVFSLVGGRYVIEWHHVMGAAFVASLPVAVIFSWLQKHLVTGLSTGAVK